MRDINMLPVPANYRWIGGKVADNFAGGGGASTGIAQALGQSPDIAVNHNAEALMMHEQNHPDTKHYNESVWDINIPMATEGHPVLMGWFSPDCTHFSVAKGGKPVKKVIRGLAWIVKKWAGQSDMAMLFMENVREFTTWGPLIAKRCKVTKRVIKLVADAKKKDKNGDPVMNEVVSEPGEYVPYRDQALVPDKKRAGKTFKQFIRQLRAAGYEVEWRDKGLNACDYGDPTTRNRFFLMARKDGLPIIWPEPTHGNKKQVNANAALKPWKTAGENLDFSIACPSIFDRKKPLAEKTLARIFKGIEKFVVGAGDDAFLVKTNHGEDRFRGQSLEDPLATLTSKLGTALTAVSLTKFNQNSVGQAADEPIDTIMAGATRFGVVEAKLSAAAVMQIGCITTIDHGGARAAPLQGLDAPLGVITSKARHIQVAALLKHFTGVTGQMLTLPLPTITATDHNSVLECTLEELDEAIQAAHIQRDFGNSVGHHADEPLGAIMPGGGGKAAIVATSLVKLKGTCKHGQSLDRPLDTIGAQGNHFSEVRSTLVPVDYHNSPLGIGDDDGRNDGIQSPGASQGVRGQAGRDGLEAGRQDEQRQAEASRAEADGQASGQRLPGHHVLVSGQAVHAQCPPGGVRGTGGADTSWAGHQPRQGQQAQQRPAAPGANDQGQQPSSRLPDGAEEASHHTDTCGAFAASQGAAGQGHDVPGDRREPGSFPDNSLQGRQAQVVNFLVKYFGTGTAVSVDEPLDTITSKARFGLVTIKGQDYQIVDIGMRMLEPHELYRCQGFPADYQHEVVMGKKLPKHAQVRMVGNSVPPGLARALVQANIPRWALRGELAQSA